MAINKEEKAKVKEDVIKVISDKERYIKMDKRRREGNVYVYFFNSFAISMSIYVLCIL